jgi:hypothetical protein
MVVAAGGKNLKTTGPGSNAPIEHRGGVAVERPGVQVHFLHKHRGHAVIVEEKIHLGVHVLPLEAW